MNTNSYETEFTENYKKLFDSCREKLLWSKKEDNAAIIINAIHDYIKPIPFCEYLKRYLFQKSDYGTSFSLVPVNDYVLTIEGSFIENNVPSSFEDAETPIDLKARKWLKQAHVKRSTVFLLGFGLKMTADDVNMFLTKALCEQGIDQNDPFELVCLYSYKNGLSFTKASELLKTVSKIKPRTMPGYYRKALLNDPDMIFSSEDNLIKHISYIKKVQFKYEKTAYEKFCLLYDQAKAIIISLSEDKNRSTESISEYEFENIINTAFLRTGSGNISKIPDTFIVNYISVHRLTRQRINGILSKKIHVEKSDIVFLDFFIFAFGSSAPKKDNIEKFVCTTNGLLRECNFHELYFPDPFECFIMLCLWTDDPFGTYSDVLEKASAKKE